MKMSDALELYKNRNTQSKTLLEDVKIQCSGSPVIDSVLYYLGMSDMHMKAYVDTRSNLRSTCAGFPKFSFYEKLSSESPFSLSSVAHSSRDQTETKEAIRLLRDFWKLILKVRWLTVLQSISMRL